MQSGHLSLEGYGAVPSSVDFYASQRSTLNDLYPSERFFFVDSVKASASVLDVGCAAGGFAEIVRSINSEASYCGIDVAEKLIDIANSKKGHLGQFHRFDGLQIPFTDGFDTVFSFGVLHHVVEVQKLISEMLRVTKRKAIFDVRLTTSGKLTDPSKHFQKIQFDDNQDSNVFVPYFVYNFSEFLGGLSKDYSGKFSLDFYGYRIKPTKFCSIKENEIYAVTCCMQRLS